MTHERPIEGVEQILESCRAMSEDRARRVQVLREALLDTVHALGGFAHETVSDDYLTYVPSEAYRMRQRMLGFEELLRQALLKLPSSETPLIAQITRSLNR